MALLLLQTGWRLLKQAGGRLRLQPPLGDGDLAPGPALWAREPGRGLAYPEAGLGLWAREPGLGLDMPPTASDTDFLGEIKLSRGGPAGEKRRPYVKLGSRAEVLAGDTLAGVPTAVVEGTGVLPATSAVAYGSVVENGATVPNCLLFTVTVGAAPKGRYVVRFHAETSGGAIYEPWCYLKLEDSR